MISRIKVLTFVKWAGGKTQLLGQFRKFYPRKIERYFEPFVGSGAVFFYIIQRFKPKEIMISDINDELINTYKIVRDEPEKLLKLLKEYRKNHNKSPKEYYYRIRALDPKKISKIEKAARFIYLNKTCFNGLYRVNSKGMFNVPFGRYKKPSMVQEDRIRLASRLLKNVKIKVMSFEKILNYTNKGDFIYFDPPYYPLKKGKSFTTYTSQNFLGKSHKKLAKVFKKLDERGCKVMLSNSDTEFIRKLYKEFEPIIVKARRVISCDAKKRGEINEVIVINYPPNTKDLLNF